MLTAKQREILEVLYNGRVPEHHKDHIPELLQKSYIVEENGHYRLTDAGLNQMRLAKGLGEAMVDVLIPGAGSGTPSGGPPKSPKR